ncbi:MAG: hypothetical protein NXI22_07070 [bacterium]|nr:hypothetical protein [bacterium]
MNLSIRPILTATMIAASLLANVEVCRAGPILDWIHARCAAKRQPVPVVTNYAPYVAGVAGSCNTCNSCPTTVGYPSCPAPAPRIQVSYAPQTSYKFGWLQVPVTTYKPSTAVDPCTGCSVVSMKPCTSYTWKLSRIPYTTYKPTFTNAAPTTVAYAPTGACCGNAAASPLGSVAPVSSTSYAAPASSMSYGAPASMAPSLGSGCSTCGNAASSAASSSYYAPSTTSPTTSYYPQSPSTGNSTVQAGPSYTVPVNPSTSAAAPQSQGATAADAAPSLSGGATTQSNFGSLGNGQSGATLQPAPAAGKSVLQGGGASTAGVRVDLHQPANVQRNNNLTPVPDPDAHLRNQAPSQPVHTAPKTGAPRLLDPRDRTASNLIRPAVYVQPASWPELNAPALAVPAESNGKPANEAPARLQPVNRQPLLTQVREVAPVSNAQPITTQPAPIQHTPAPVRNLQPQLRRPVAAEPVWDDSGWQSLN